ncbi:MAG: DUF1638 domain-containing protein, partial [candidate division NC10 bacterium]|nr:DUF1638 domain-containing protein [candidate division NC10 bacterium]
MKSYVIACEVFKDEFLNFQGPDLEYRFLPQGYHRTPGRMPPIIQEEIDRAPEGVEAIILGYGLCSNGVVGLQANHAPLVIPKVHDCIAMLMGSRTIYEEEAATFPGTYYLTRGWIEYGKTPYSQYKDEYLKQYDEETATWIAKEMMKHYQRVALIDHGLWAMDKYRAFAKEMAAFYGILYEEMKGSLEYIRRLLFGPWDHDDFIVI